MRPMSQPDHLDLDGRLLQLLVTVLDTGSVTAAAQRLGVTQSAVSHGLERLRAIVGDALFVKAGRGIAPTERARALGIQARELLAGLQRLAEPERFDPASLRGEITIAANDLQCHLLDKLRTITGDPLFVKSGRGIVATARAEALAS